MQVEVLSYEDAGESGGEERKESEEESGAPLGESTKAFFAAIEVSCTFLNQVGFWILVLTAGSLDKRREVVVPLLRAEWHDKEGREGALGRVQRAWQKE